MLLVLALIATIVGGIIFFTTRTEPAAPLEQAEAIIPIPAELPVTPVSTTTPVASSTQASSSPQ